MFSLFLLRRAKSGRGRRPRRTTIARSRGLLLLLLILIAASSFVAAAKEPKQKILSIFFDGIPTPEERAARKAAEEEKKAQKEAAKHPAPAPAPGSELPDVTVAPPKPEEKPRPEIEKLKSWEEVLGVLPKDLVGGPDWVKALKDGVIAPRRKIPVDPDVITAPFTLDTVVPATVPDNNGTLDLNIEIVPPKAPFYKVVFPHSSHTMWLNCSSCHPGIVAQRGSGMGKILAGEYCGRCHGKVSFEPLTSCARCHVNLVPASQTMIDEDMEKALKSPVPASSELIEKGKALYLQDCAICHGEKGDGKGLLAESLDTKPRNFTTGKFKFRSTNSSSIPTDADFFRTVTRGIPGTAMPSFSFLSYEERFALVHFIKTFSERFKKEKPAETIKIPDPPPLTPELLALGKQMFKDAECFKCHGEEGKGNGPSSVGMKNDWGEAIRPFDFTSGRPKSGSALKDYYKDIMTGLQGTPMAGAPERVEMAKSLQAARMKDYYKDVMTGLQGTPMPDFGDVFEGDQGWAVVYYVYSLGNERRNLPPHVRGDIHFTRKTPEQIAALTKAKQQGSGNNPWQPTLVPGLNAPAPPPPGSALADQPAAGEANKAATPPSTPQSPESEVKKDAPAAPTPEAAPSAAADAKKEAPAAAKADAPAAKPAESEAKKDAPGAKPEVASKAAAAIDPAMLNDENQPPATFPHWFHRMRVRCAVCHPRFFEMKKDSNPITMEAIRAGKFCGNCHPSYPDPKTLAWPVKFEFCPRCHVPQE